MLSKNKKIKLLAYPLTIKTSDWRYLLIFKILKHQITCSKKKYLILFLTKAREMCVEVKICELSQEDTNDVTSWVEIG